MPSGKRAASKQYYAILTFILVVAAFFAYNATKLRLGHNFTPLSNEAFYNNITAATGTTNHPDTETETDLSTATSNNNYPTHNITKLPSWMQEYFEWHNEQRNSLNETNWLDNSNRYRYLILRCVRREDAKCGGTSDRLKCVPLMLRLAYETKRLFFIRWDRPCRLEEFLQPTPYLNWSVPEWMVETLGTTKHKTQVVAQKGNLEKAARSDVPILEARHPSASGGDEQYIKLVQAATNDPIAAEENYETVYHDTFRAIFQPSPPVAELVAQQLDRNGLHPGQYSVAHFRAYHKVPKITVSQEFQTEGAITAVNCASQLHPGDPIYFASDSSLSARTVKEYGETHNRTIVTNQNANNEPLHLDKASLGNGTHEPYEYYDSFVDLLVMGNGRCVAYGKGGFGPFASLMSYDSKCKSKHHGATCAWQDP
jgi:hypothetical protein